MTVCQFFLQGRCRFGQNCRFEHSFAGDDRNNRNAANSQHLSNVVKQIMGEVILVEKGGQWPLSSFSPIKHGANIPGWEDVSPEEVRWKMYEARNNGTLNQAISEINQLYKEAEKRRNILKQPTMEVINMIINVLKGKKEATNAPNPFQSSTNSTSSNIFGGSSSPSTGTQNIFGNSSQPAGNIFGGSSQSPGIKGNIFGGSGQSPVPQSNIFGGSTTTNFPNQNIFGGSTTPSNNFSQNVFSNSPAPSQNIFSNSSPVGSGSIFSNSPTQNIFSNAQISGQGNQNIPSNVFSSPNSSGIFSNQASNSGLFASQNKFFPSTENQTNVFGGAQTDNIFHSQNSFGKTGNVFGTQQQNIFGGQTQYSTNSSFNTQQRPNAMDSSVYSKVEDLNEEEIKSFQAATFTFGKIPLKPPPQEYCK